MPSSTTSPPSRPVPVRSGSTPEPAPRDASAVAFAGHFAEQLPVLLRAELLHLRDSLIGPAALISHVALGWTPEDLREALPDAAALRPQLAQCMPYVVSMAAGAAALAVQRAEALPAAQAAHDVGPSTATPHLEAPRELPELAYDALWEYIAAQRKNGSLVDDPAWDNGTKAKHRMASRVQASLNALDKDFTAAAMPLLAVPSLRRAIEPLNDPVTAELLATALQSLEAFPLAAPAGPQPLEPQAPSLAYADALLTHGTLLSRRMQAAATLRAKLLAKAEREHELGVPRAWHGAAVGFPGSRVDNKEQVKAHMSAAEAWQVAPIPKLDGVEEGPASMAVLDAYFGAMDRIGAIQYEALLRHAIASHDRALAALRELADVPLPLSLAAHRARLAASASSGPATGASGNAAATPGPVSDDEWTRRVKYRCHRRRGDAGHHLAAFKWKCPLLGEPKRSAVLLLATQAVQDCERAMAHAATTSQRRGVQESLDDAQKTLVHVENGTVWWDHDWLGRRNGCGRNGRA